MTEKPKDHARVAHKKHGDGTVQPLFKNLHPNFPDDLVYVKFDNWPLSTAGEKMGVDVIEVFTDELELI